MRQSRVAWKLELLGFECFSLELEMTLEIVYGEPSLCTDWNPDRKVSPLRPQVTSSPESRLQQGSFLPLWPSPEAVGWDNVVTFFSWTWKCVQYGFKIWPFCIIGGKLNSRNIIIVFRIAFNWRKSNINVN